MRAIFATNNKNKLVEARAILADSGLEILSPAELGLDLEVEETGDSFEANALLKARAFFAAASLPVLADDSGLVVEALDGAPGVHSARYAGHHGDDQANTRYLLEKLARVPAGQRDAAFVCALVWLDQEGATRVFIGRVAGEIAREPAGAGGFGYDPVFYLPEQGMTMAELDFETKNSLSHRRRALDGFKAWWLARHGDQDEA